MIANYLSYNCYIQSLFSFKHDLGYEDTMDTLVMKDKFSLTNIIENQIC